MLEKILVGFDGSPQSRRAGHIATEIAARFHASLVLLHVRPPPRRGVDPVLEDLVPVSEEGRALSTLIEDARERALARGVARVEVVTLHGETLPAMLDWLHRNPQDLVVVGSRSLSRGRRFFLGSVSSGLVTEAPCPVLVVRGSHGPRVPDEVAHPPRGGPGSLPPGTH